MAKLVQASKRSAAIGAILAGVVWCGASEVAYGAIISTYTFTGADPAGDAETPAVTGAVFSSFSRVNLTAHAVNDQFVSNDFAGGASIDTSEYIEFTVTADAGYKLDLESISFKHTRVDQNTTSRRGPQSGAIRADFESFGPGSGTGSTFSPVTSQTTSTWDFDDYSTLPGGSVTFRFYGWNQTGAPGHNSQRLNLDDVTLYGEVTPVILAPEPATFVGGSLAGLTLLFLRRRR